MLAALLAFSFFFFNDTATTEIYTLSLHDALPICALGITLAEHGADLSAGRLTIEPPDRPRDFRIASGPRVGITRSVELRLRFWIAGNSYVSPPRSASK